ACVLLFFFFFSSRRRHTRLQGDWSSDVCSSDLWNFVDDWAIRGGYFFRPSPLPKQDGFTNYLDNDVHGFSAGIAWTAPDYLEIRSEERRVGKECRSRRRPER